MKKYNEFIIEQKSTKYVKVDYKIIKKDLKHKPELLITDFKIISSEDNKSKIKAKGYIISNLDDNRKGWIAFDDFKDDTTRIVWNKNFENGSKKIKVYQ